MTKLTTEFICAAVAGATVDGREITENMLNEAGSSYDPSVYNARLWAEHLRGVLPNGLFRALGDVVETKLERLKAGALSGKLALFVKLAPEADLITLVRSGQKVHLSVELQPNFADTGKYYLVGVGVTDSPASLGTGLMKFNTKKRQDNLFSTPHQVSVDLSESENMTPDQFKQIVQAAVREEVAGLRADLMNEIKQFSQDTSGTQAQIIDMLTPPAGEMHSTDHYREPHKGGDSERRTVRY